jgi:DNA ligase (NAD+)
MNKKLILEDYLKKIEKFQKLNEAYYDINKPLVADSEFDKLKLEIIKLEKKYSFLKSDFSPKRVVGFKPSRNFQKIFHKVPMLSLANAFSENDLVNFEKKILNYLSKEKNFEIIYSSEPKIDGISASLIYKYGKFTRGLSRGDGKEGEDITANLNTIDDIPKFIAKKDFPKEIDIRGEVYIQNSDFETLKDKFANPRNAASGSLRQKNSDETKKIPLKFIAYTYGYEEGLNLHSQSEFLKKLNHWGFKINPFNRVIKGIKNLIKNYNELEYQRKNIDFDIDGIVYKVDNFELQKRLGYVANAPRWAIAHKFSSNKAVSEIIDIEIQVGRTGALTPVAKIKPINIGGVVVSNATLHNEDEIIRKDIRVGDTVIVERAGDVIPHILSVDLKKRNDKSKKFLFPKSCPSCGSKTIKEFNILTKKKDAVRRCSSEGYYCEKVSIEKLKHFVSKEALNIEGFGKKIVENFWNLKLIRFPQDIFKLDYHKIKNLDGWGELSVENLKYSINNKRNISLDRFIYSLGIRHIGLENAKLLAKYFVSFSNFKKLSNKIHIDDILNIDGIGEAQTNSLKNFFSNRENLNVLEALEKVLKIGNFVLEKKDGLLKNQTFLVTGKLDGLSRAEVKSIIERNSGTVVSSVTKKLNFLIVGEKPTKRKVDSAKELEIKIITQTELFKMLNLTS